MTNAHYATSRRVSAVLIALLLAFVFVISSTPEIIRVLAQSVSAAQNEQTNFTKEQNVGAGLSELNPEPAYDKTEIIAEMTEKRTELSKTFARADGTYVVQQYAVPVHYLDGSEYKEIDNTLDSQLKTTANSFAVDFAEDGTDSLVRIGNDIESVSMTPVFGAQEASLDTIKTYDGTGKAKNITQQAAKAKTRALSTPKYENTLSSSLDELNVQNPNLEGALKSSMSKLNSSIYYQDVYNNVDIQYIIENQSLKENIIVAAPLSEYVFRFALSLNGLYAQKTLDGDIILYRANGEAAYTIPKGYMYDASGNYSYDVEYFLDWQGDACFLSVVAASEFFETCAFPVVVDPTIAHVAAEGKNNMVIGRHHDVNSSTSATGVKEFKFWNNRFMGIGDSIAIHYGYLNLGTQTTADFVSKNEIISASYSFKYTNTGKLVPMIKSITNYKKTASTLYALEYYRNTTSKMMYINVTDYLNKYLGKAVISIKETDSNNSDFSSATLTMNYREPSVDYDITQDIGAGGAASVNMYNGELSYTYEDANINDGFMPINISHVYNQGFGDEYGVGTNFKLNIQQRVGIETITNGGYYNQNYYYVSASGKKYYFTNGTIPQNRELGLMLYKNTSTGIIRLVDRQGNSMVFGSSGNLIQMHQYPSKYEAPINSLMLSLTYNGNKITNITNTRTNLVLGYDGADRLSCITNQTTNTRLVDYCFDSSSNRLIEMEKYTFNSGVYTELSYVGDKLSNIACAYGAGYTYDSAGRVDSITCQNYRISGSAETVNLSYVENTGTTDNITKTVVLSSDDRYFRHVSFSADVKNRIVADYSFEKDGDNIIPLSETSNKFDNTSFVDAYGDSKDLYYQEFNQSIYYNNYTQQLNYAPQTDFVAVSAWVKSDNGLATTLSMQYIPSSGTSTTYKHVFNLDLDDWQFVTLVVPSSMVKSTSKGTALLKIVGADKMSIRIVEIPQWFPEAKQNEFTPEYNSADQLTRVYQHNAVDNTITMQEHTYSANSAEYPGQLLTVCEYQASASLTKTQFLAQCTLQSKVEYTYFDSTSAHEGYIKSIKTYGTTADYSQEEYTYNSDGQVASYTDASGVQTEYAYDGDTVITSVDVYNTPLILEEQYDPNTGLLLSTAMMATWSDPVGADFSYNAFGDLSSVTHNGFATSFSYYSDRSLLSISVPGKSLVSYTYSLLQDTTTYGNGQVLKYNYNTDGALTSIQNAANVELAEFSYNNAGALSAVADSNGVSYAYDYARELSQVGMGNVSVAYTMNNSGNALQVHYAGADAAGNPTGSYYYLNGSAMDSYLASYNSRGQLTNLGKTDGQISYAYDNNYRLSGKSTSYTPSNTSFDYSYTYASSAGNLSPRLSGSTFTSGNMQNIYQYEYLPDGNLNGIYKNGDWVAGYAYDAFGRLVVCEVAGMPNMQYEYDAGGNITYASYPHGNKFFYYNDAAGYKDLLTSFTVNSNTYNISYDGAGNPVYYKNQTLTWQNGRELASYGSNISYTYDYAGNRTSKTVNGTETYYMLEEGRILAEKTGNNVTWFFYDESGVYGMRYAGTDYIFEKNIFGDIVAIYNMSTGAFVGGYTYDAWGNILTCTNNAVTNANPFRYRGYYYDTETGFYYLNSRYYDPQICRFISPDNPKILSFSSKLYVDGANLYAYCVNNPVRYIDVVGMMPTENLGLTQTEGPGIGASTSLLIGSIKYIVSAKTQKPNSLLYSYSEVNSSDNTTRNAVGLNIGGRAGVEFYAQTGSSILDFALGIDIYMGPLSVGVSIGGHGIGFSLGIDIGNTTHTIEGNIGLATIGAAGVALALYMVPEPTGLTKVAATVLVVLIFFKVL